MIKNNIDDSSQLTPEELLGPPKIDGMGFLLMIIVWIVTGFLIGIVVFLLSFVFLGTFSFQSGSSPLILAMITFIATVLGNVLYVWWLWSIFPHIYSRSSVLFMHVTVFSIILYICMAIVYWIVSSYSGNSTHLLLIYTSHIILDVFWLILITGILSIYRYSLLIFYASIISLLISFIIPVIAASSMNSSANTLFLFMWFSAIAFLIGTVVAYGILFAYYKLYNSTGYDPIGNVFERIYREEHDREKEAEKSLFH